MTGRAVTFATFAALVAVTASLPARAAPPGLRRIAVLVGANDPSPGRPALRFAHDDASELAGVLGQVGGFAPSDVHVLFDPQPTELVATLEGVRATTSGAGGDVLFVFYYSGHSDGQALYPHGLPILLSDLRARIENLGARIRVGILDTCRGGGWTQSKGLSVGPPPATADLLNLDTEGTALVSSSSGIEDAHEAETVRGSFFTHHFAAGLRGAADREGDGAVTLQEAFEYARDRTVRDSTRLANRPQHPSFDLALRGRQDIVLATLPATTSALQITSARAPVEIIHLPTGITIADAPTGQRRLRIALPPGRYLVRSVVEGRVYAKEVEIHPGETASLADGDLTAIESEALAAKGADEQGRPTVPDLRPTALVHIEGSRVTLERSDRDGPWQLACTSPCDRDLPVTSAYRLTGPGVRNSGAFQLAARAGERVVIHANAASRAAFVGGIVLTGAGGVSMLAGLLVGETIAADRASGHPPSGGQPNDAAAVGMLAGGAAAVLAGVLFVTENLRSRAEQSPEPSLPPSPSRGDVWLRTPTWRDDRTAAALGAGAAGATLVQVGF